MKGEITMIMVDQSPAEKNFVQNPYAFYRFILKRGGVCFWKNYNQKAFFNFGTINKIFKDKRFGRELPSGFKQPNEKNLCDVLLDLKVDVYFASKIVLKNNMIYVEEPSINTKNAKKMRGILKVKPKKIFKSNSVKIYAFEIKDKKDCFFE